jgi:serpin B
MTIYCAGASATVSFLLAIAVGCHSQSGSSREADVSKVNPAASSASQAHSDRWSDNTQDLVPDTAAGQNSDAPIASPFAEIQFQEAVFRKLQQKVDWHLKDETLAKLADRLSSALGVRVFLDKPALETAGVATNTKLAGDFENVTVEFVLDRVLWDLSVDWTLAGNTLMITTDDVIEKNLLTRVYNVGDLVATGKFDAPSFELLIDTIQNHISPSSWAENGGGWANISPFEAGGLNVLVISQTARAHHQIAKLLADMREARGDNEPGKYPPNSTAELRDKLALLDDSTNRRSATKDERRGNGREIGQIPLSSEQLMTAVRRCNQFSIELFRQTSNDVKQNHLVSGYSARELLVFAGLGSRGETWTEFEQLLQLPKDRKDAALEVLFLRSTLREKKANGNVFQVGNSMWVQRELLLRDEFVKMADGAMNAFAGRVNFKSSEEAVAEINRWAAENTRQRVTKLLASSDITPETFVVLANTVYFLGKWENPFDVKHTKPRAFTLLDGTTADVEMMSEEVSSRSGMDSESGVQIAELLYRGKMKSMVILLPPKHEQALTELEQTLDAKKLDEWLSELQVGKVTVKLPKFTFRRRSNLTGPLAKIGGKRMFDLGSADFSGISNNPLALQFVFQEAFIAVDETGTEAAAATAVGAFGGARPLPEPEFIVDRPFIFLIRDVTTGCLIFLGRVVDPRPGK